jgi:hypothetical protein
MPVPDRTLKYHEKDLLDRIIDTMVARQGLLTDADINQVMITAQVQCGIDKYLAAAKSMSTDQLRFEPHASSRLARHLEQTGKKRPARCHAHAIVAGKHTYAAILRVIMAKLKIRIDDPDNGCWLPENTAATPHPAFPKAIPHSRIHRFNYYFWLRSRLGNIRQETAFRKTLQLTTQHLQEHTFPEYVMLKKGANLPADVGFA